MNREQRLEMLGRLAEVPSVELKMNIRADQRMALSGLELDAMRGRLREVFFFDTPDLTLYRNGLVIRARRTQGDDDDT
jgi:inorganic triphosphatase YgiF